MHEFFNRQKDFLKGKVYDDQENYYPTAFHPTGYSKKLARARQSLYLICGLSLCGGLYVTFNGLAHATPIPAAMSMDKIMIDTVPKNSI